jgi:hypothetical protein
MARRPGRRISRGRLPAPSGLASLSAGLDDRSKAAVYPVPRQTADQVFAGGPDTTDSRPR